MVSRSQPMIRGPYERIYAGVLAFVIGWALIPISIWIYQVVECIGAMFRWSFG